MHLIIPGLLDTLPVQFKGQEIPPFLQIEKILSRANTQNAEDDYHKILFSYFSGLTSENTTYPIAALNHLAETGQAHSGYLMHADPVHLRPEQDCLLLFDFTHLELSETDAQTYIDAFNKHFVEDGLRLFKTETKHWYLHVNEAPQLTMSSLTDVIGHNIDRFLPSGEDSTKWRHLLNEIQMVFFSLAEDLPMVSSVWFHGGGELSEINTDSLNQVSGDSLLIKGLAQQAKIKFQADFLDNQNDLLVIESIQRAIVDVDFDSWIKALTELEIILTNLKSKELSIYPCNGNVYHWQAANKWHFWKSKINISAL